MNRIIEIIRSNKRINFVSLLIFSTFFFCIFSYILPIRFETNDDYIMCLIANGSYTGSPDYHLIFINFIYGWVLQQFYLFIPFFEWYSIFFSILHIISISIIAWYIINSKTNSVVRIVCFLLLFLLQIKLIESFQFTTTAAITGISGLVLLLRDSWWSKLIGAIIFFVATLVRFDAALLVLLISSPLIIYEFFYKSNLKLAAVIFTVVSIAFFSKYIDNRQYDKFVNGDYKAYDYYRGKINNNLNTFRVIDKLPADISKTDFFLLTNFLVDKNIITLDKIESIYNVYDEVPVIYLLKNAFYSLLKYKFTILVLLFMYIFLIVAAKNNQYRYVLFLCFSIFILACTYVTFQDILKERVFISAVLPLVLVYFYFSIIIYTKSRWHLFFLFLLGFILLIDLNLNKRDKTDRLYDEMINYAKYNNHSLVISSIPSTINIFNLKEYFSGLQIKSAIGFMLYLDINKFCIDSHLRFLEDDVNIMIDNSVFFSFERGKKIDVVGLIIEGLKRNYGVESQVNLIYTNDKYSIVQLRKSS